MVNALPHVIFRLGRQAFAIALAEVKDVARAPQLSAVPCAVPAVRGIAVLREQFTTVVDLRARFGLPTSSQIGTALVVEHEGERIALLVDRMEEVLNLAVTPPTSMPRDPLWQGVIAGIIHREKDMVVVLDVPAIVEGSGYHLT